MKLEFLNDLSDGGKYGEVISDNLIRLYDFDCTEAKMLMQLIQENLLNKRNNLDLNEIHFIEALNCKLLLKVSTLNTGIVHLENDQFVCLMNAESYKHMVSNIEPFTEGELNGFNWLDDLVDNDNQIDFLFSPGGGW